MSEPAIMSALSPERLPAEFGSPTAELSDLVRALAQTFKRAQAQLARRQEELLASLLPGATPGTALLRARLPSGAEMELMPLELCTTRCQYLADMEVDLMCLVQDVTTENGLRTGLQVLPRASFHSTSLPVRLSFAPGESVRAEICFANQTVRTIELPEQVLPTAEVAAKTQRALLFLVDPADVAHIPEWARVKPPPALPLVSVAAGEPKGQSPLLSSDSLALPTPAVQRHPSRKRRRATAVLLGLCALCLLIKFSLERALGPTRDSQRLPPVAVPADLSRLDLSRSTVPDGGAATPDLASRRPAEPPIADAAAAMLPAATMQAASVLAWFYYYDQDNVTSLECNGQVVAGRRETKGGRWVARVLLKPGVSCRAIGLGRERVYTYDALAHGKPWHHLRFRKHLVYEAPSPPVP